MSAPAEKEEKTAKGGGEEAFAADPHPDINMFPVAALVGTIVMAVDANNDLIFSFFPGWFLDHGVPLSKSGSAFAANGVTMMIGSLFVPWLMGGAAGAPKTLFNGALMLCVALTIRALLPFVAPYGPNALLTYYLLNNAFLGMAVACVEVSALTWVLLSVQPSERTAAVAAVVNARSLGALLGPALGGVLYTFAGLTLTVLMGMGLMLTATLLSKTRIFESSLAPAGEMTKPSAQGSIMRDPATVACFGIMFVTLAAMMSYVSVLQAFLRDAFGTSEWVVGLIYSGVMIPFIIGAMIAAPLEKAVGPMPPILAGTLIAALGFLFLGGSPLLGIEPNFWLSLGAFNSITLGLALPMVIIAPLSITKAKEAGYSETDAGTESAMINVFFAAGSLLVGPPAGGYLADAVGVGWCFTIVGLAFAACMVLLSVAIRTCKKSPPPMW